MTLTVGLVHAASLADEIPCPVALELLELMDSTRSDAVCLCDASFSILYANAAASQLLGYAPAELTGSHRPLLSGPPPNNSATQNQSGPAETSQCTFALATKAGTSVFCNATLRTREDNAGSQLHIITLNPSTGGSASARPDAAPGAMQGFFENAAVFMALLEIGDSDFRYVMANRMVADFFGVSAEAMRGRTARSLGLEEEFVRSWIEAMNESLVAGSTIVKEYSIVQNGQVRWFLGSLTPEGTKSSTCRRVSLVATEMTALKNAEGALEASERRYKKIFEQSNEGFFQTTSSGELRIVNPAGARMLGYDTPEECIGALKTIQKVYAHPGDRQRFLSNIATHGYVSNFELEFLRTDGRTIWVAISARLISDDSGQSIVEGMVQEITRQKEAMEQLRKSEELFRLISENVAELIALIDVHGTCMYASRSFRQLGVNPDTLTGVSLLSIIHPDERDAVMEEIRRCVEVFTTGTRELRMQRIDGTWRTMETTFTVLVEDEGLRVVAVARDITEKMQRVALVRKLSSAVEQSPASIVITDVNGAIEYVNPRFTQVTGYTSAEVRGQNPRMLKSGETPVDEYATMWRTLLSGNEWRGEFHNKRKDGSLFWEFASITPLKNDHGDVTHLLAVKEDITARKQSEQELALQISLLRTQQESSLDAVLLVDEKGLIRSFNSQFTEMWRIPVGRANGALDESLVQSVVDQLIRPDEFIDHIKFIYTQREQKSRDTLRLKDGRTIDRYSSPVLGTNGEYFGRVWYFRDITDRIRREEERDFLGKQLEARNAELEATLEQVRRIQNTLVQSEKMASIGQLTAGIAHEINNPLAFVSSNLNRFAEYFEEALTLLHHWQAIGFAIDDQAPLSPLLELARKEEAHTDLEFISVDFRRLMEHTRDGAHRIKVIVERLRGFAHLAETDMADADVNAALEDSLNIVWNELKYKATIERHFGTLPPVTCTVGEIKQVFVNLLINAAHAISESGRITLTTRLAGEFVEILVTDTGCGISPANLKRIFDPFFTTKAVGKGTGLGLWISTTIIHKHNGTITVDSTLGRGSTFMIRLPLSCAREQATTHPEEHT
jgi:PAS domain S-box-containing protein